MSGFIKNNTQNRPRLNGSAVRRFAVAEATKVECGQVNKCGHEANRCGGVQEELKTRASPLMRTSEHFQTVPSSNIKKRYTQTVVRCIMGRWRNPVEAENRCWCHQGLKTTNLSGGGVRVTMKSYMEAESLKDVGIHRAGTWLFSSSMDYL